MRTQHRQHTPMLHWCDSCNVPLVGRTCGRCGHNGRPVELSPPGDVRLALEGTRRRLRYLFLRHFGVQQLIPDITVLNKTSGEDRAEEIIVDGRRIALLSYDLERADYRLTLRIDGARMLAHMRSKKEILLRKTDGHMKGNYLPREYISSFDSGIKAGDEVVVQMGKFIGCGSAKVDASELRTSAKGVKVRDITQSGPMQPGRRAWPKDLVKANLPHMMAKRAKAEHELRDAMAESRLPLSVSFSGGKDSLVVLDLVSSVTKDFTAIFVDTGLEHPMTRDHVKGFAEDNSLRLIIAHAGDAFDDNFPSFGPPAKDFRWCCKVCKLAPASKAVEESFPEGTLTVEGNRRLESFSRARLQLMERNPFVPGQTVVNLIRDWTALDVWLYILWRGLRYNPLYDEDIERVGCWMCPSALASECAEISRMSPELAKAWEQKLHAWASENGLPSQFVQYGFWRWKQLPPKMQSLAGRLGITAMPKRADALGLHVVKGISPCAAGGYSVEAVLRTPETKGLSDAAEILKTVGDVDLVEEFGVAMVHSKNSDAKVFAGGQISSVGRTPEEAMRCFDSVARAVLRANMCTKCGICVRTCPEDAITLKDSIIVDERACTQCGKCAESCVVAHYFDKLAGEVSARKPKGGRSG
ncbi:MAG: phosphoadenosine phosphosulfate reductase family protein [Candidatus Thermoplasmatota archaeon]|nr:phosphoadenosine phosphosulfate reductase family protein [Candidatus Thermoplasmatota archaeon]